MKITRSFLRNLLNEAKGDKSCKRATQNSKFNSSQKIKAAKSKKIAYGPPERPELEKLVSENKLCGNCGAFDVTEEMQKCMDVEYKDPTAEFLIEGKKKGYCLMHDFMCSGHKTCLTWGSGGPKK